MASPEKINIKAAAWTIGVHTLLLLLFLVFSYSLPASAPVEEMGMEVNLGTSDNGSGADQPMSVEQPSSDNVIVSNNSAAHQTGGSKEMMQNDDPNAPSIEPAKAKKTNDHNTDINKPVKKNDQQANPEGKNKQQPKYLYAGSNGKGGNGAATNQPGTGEGNTTGKGDRGVPNGTPGAANYTGSPGTGNGGISHTLTGRDISPSQFVAEFNESGKVVIRVTVDREGNITNKSIQSSPSSELSKIALQKLAQAKFSKNPNAEPQQFGTITIVFKTRS
ncbi:MAG: TonB family protein [Bacteroidota bacterium]